MGLVHSENLAVVPSEFKRLSVKRLQNVCDYLNVVIQSVKHVDDPDYGEVATSIANARMSLEQIEYSFEEIDKFMKGLAEKANKIAEEKMK